MDKIRVVCVVSAPINITRGSCETILFTVNHEFILLNSRLNRSIAMNKLLLPCIILITACWAIIAREQGNFAYFQVLKPLTTILIISMALMSANQENKIYNKYLLIALCFCLAGDILLLKEQYFVFGLAAFLIAHIVFIYAFSTVYGFSRNYKPLIVLMAVCVPYFFYLKTGLGALLVPVAVYLAAIMTMGWQAIALYLKDRQTAFLFIAIAAILFMLSDSLLAFDKFVKPFPWAGILILFTYWLAIFTLAFTCGFVKIKQVRAVN